MGVSAVLTSNAAPSYSRTLEGVRNARVGARVGRNQRGRKYSSTFRGRGGLLGKSGKCYTFARKAKKVFSLDADGRTAGALSASQLARAPHRAAASLPLHVSLARCTRTRGVAAAWRCAMRLRCASTSHRPAPAPSMHASIYYNIISLASRSRIISYRSRHHIISLAAAYYIDRSRAATH